MSLKKWIFGSCSVINLLCFYHVSPACVSEMKNVKAKFKHITQYPNHFQVGTKQSALFHSLLLGLKSAVLWSGIVHWNLHTFPSTKLLPGVQLVMVFHFFRKTCLESATVCQAFLLLLLFGILWDQLASNMHFRPLYHHGGRNSRGYLCTNHLLWPFMLVWGISRQTWLWFTQIELTLWNQSVLIFSIHSNRIYKRQLSSCAKEQTVQCHTSLMFYI